MDFTPDVLNSLTGAGVLGLVCLSLITGKGGLATARELKTAQEEIRLLRERNEELVKQNGELIHEIGPAVTEFMRGVKQAAEDRA